MKVIIIDDDFLVVDALKTIVEASGIQVAATGQDGQDAIRLAREFRPDVILMDIRMQSMNGLEATRSILSEDPAARILLITTFQDEEYIAGALSLGCKGYILKSNIAGILPAIQAVHSGQMVFDSKVVQSLQHPARHHQFPQLSEREEDILRLVAEGLNNREIADRLFLSEGTVRNYISTLLDKLELRDRTQLAIFFYRKS
ncbi:response regulator transcription factor [Proteiniclasticum sp. QWL-01]|uniref:response regulator n=1 Tax=Proteiniclasticum sp. QWL-01 TaxID=3036945 RepID=UPI0022091A6D|nr:response regulator transcription factor [Proteiniclasticum sp. QWL-01]UUM11112.1 response regulator transcription factor [Clostridiaceae bacterium HFYG-1003]WFF72449.1 response regulator transcription factor [Proteiniclasticum sp. QWL-01]